MSLKPSGESRMIRLHRCALRLVQMPKPGWQKQRSPRRGLVCEPEVFGPQNAGRLLLVSDLPLTRTPFYQDRVLGFEASLTPGSCYMASRRESNRVFRGVGILC